MHYSLKQLSVFDAAADLASISQAAKQLELTQSAASSSLIQLEKSVGKPLFERQGKQMTLTYWGMLLRPKVKRLLQNAQHIDKGFYNQHLLSGKIKLAASQTPGEHIVPNLISQLDRDFPEIEIALNVRSTNSVIKGVLNYKYDLGIIEGRCDDNRTDIGVLCEDHLSVVASSHHPYALHDEVSLAQLEQAKWVLRESGSGTRQIFDHAISKLIPDLDVWREYDHVPVLQSIVANGQYLTCLPYLDVKQDIESGKLVALNVPDLCMKRTISFIWRRDMSENPLSQRIMREGQRMMRRYN